MRYPVRPGLSGFSYLCFFVCYVIIYAHRAFLYLINHETVQMTFDTLVDKVPGLDSLLWHAVSWPITGVCAGSLITARAPRTCFRA